MQGEADPWVQGQLERASRSGEDEGHWLEKAEEVMEGLKSAHASGMGALLSSRRFFFPPFPSPSSQCLPWLCSF